MNFNKKMYLIDQNQYDKLLALNKTGTLPPEVQVNQLQTKFIKDRIKNQNENDNLWSRIHDKIEPLINSHASIPQPPPLQQTPIGQGPPSSVHHGFTTPPATPISSYFPSLPPPAPSVARKLDRSFRRVEGPSQATGVREEEEPEEEEEEDEEERGAVGGMTREEENRLKERDRRQSVLGDILKGISTRNRSKLISLYHTLCEQPNVYITPSEIIINGVKSRGSTIQVLSQLVSSRKTFDYKDDLALIKVLANVPDILFVVMNEKAVSMILDANDGKTTDGTQELRTPNTVKKRPRVTFKPPVETPKEIKKQRESSKRASQILQDWGRENDIELDTRYPLTPRTVRDILNPTTSTSGKKGKGKLSQKRRLKWESLF